MVRLANHWAHSGHEVRLLTFDQARPDFYSVDARVQRIVLGGSGASSSAWQALRQNWRRLRLLRAALRGARPEVVISFMESTNVLVLLAAAGLGARVIISERNNPRQNPLPLFWRVARRLTYRYARTLVVQTNAVQSWYQARGLSRRIAVIPNPVAVDFVTPAETAGFRSGMAAEPRCLLIAAVGRLDRQKGFDLLIEAFALARRAQPEIPVRLCIAGQGPLRDALQARIAAAGLSDCISLLGNVNPVEGLLLAADLFVVASRFEGFPNVLVEAMALGRPVVSFDCEYGPREIIRPEVDGLLVPAGDIARLADAINRLTRDAGLRRRLGAAAADIAQRLDTGHIAAAWEAEMCA
jgi:glycosyltransferase involved in cell wall biosynthesis